MVDAVAGLGVPLRVGERVRLRLDLTRAAFNYNNQYVSVSRTSLITGLVRNREYAMLQTVMVPAGGATITAMSIIVHPTR